MSEMFDGRSWIQVINTLSHMDSLCQNQSIVSKKFSEYLTNVPYKDFYSKFQQVMNQLGNQKPTLESFEEFGHFINSHLDDFGWMNLIKDTRLLEKVCTSKLNDFQHLNWAFQAGIANDPLKSYLMYSKITNLIPEEEVPWWNSK